MNLAGGRAGHQIVRAAVRTHVALGRRRARPSFLQRLHGRRRDEEPVQRQHRRARSDRFAAAAGGARAVPRLHESLRRRVHARRLVRDQRREPSRHERVAGLGVRLPAEQVVHRAQSVPSRASRTSAARKLGLNVRGPIAKDKLFIAASYELTSTDFFLDVNPTSGANWAQYKGSYKAPNKNHTLFTRLTWVNSPTSHVRRDGLGALSRRRRKLRREGRTERRHLAELQDLHRPAAPALSRAGRQLRERSEPAVRELESRRGAAQAWPAVHLSGHHVRNVGLSAHPPRDCTRASSIARHGMSTPRVRTC